MKKLLLSFVAISMLVASMTSCQKTGKNYQQAIPADASGVAAINLKQLGDKADVSETTKKQLIKVLQDGLNAKHSEMIEKFLNNPEMSGVSMSDPLFVFGNASKAEIGVVAKVKSKSQLEDLLSVLQTEGVCSAPTQKDSYTEVIIYNQVLAYDDNTLLLIVNQKDTQKGQQAAATYMTQKPEQSIVSNEYFQKIIGKNADMSCFYSGKLLTEMTKYSPNPNMMPLASAYGDSATMSQLNITGSLNFEQGCIKAEGEYTSSNKEALEKFQQSLPVNQKQNNTFLNRFPASTLFYTGMNLNGEKLYQLLAPSLGNLLGDKQVDLAKMFQSFNGDLSVGLTQLGTLGIPSFLAYAEVKDNYPLTFIQEQANGKIQLVPNGKDAWKAGIPMLNMNFFFGIKNNQFYFTNDADIYARIDQPAENPLGDTQPGKNLKDTYACSFINFKQIAQIPMLDMLYTQMGAQGIVVKSTLDGCDYCESYNPSLTKNVFNFYLKDKNQNALKTIVSGVEQHLPTFIPQN